ncbi:MAG: class I SAM-dependent methyltransferase [Dehalococcoidia bacterium]
MPRALPSMYAEFASWFHLLSPPAEYEGEANFYRQALLNATNGHAHTVLELGSGGGSMASHLKQQFELTLVDLSPEMLALSATINPECEHIQGDMRSVRLGRSFDAVFVHDAIAYMLTERDLRSAMETAFVHCKPGGIAVFVPDCLRESFAPGTDHGGTDGDGRSMRYLEWMTDTDPTDTTYEVDYAYLFHEDGKPVRIAHDRHVEGLFGCDDWLRLLRDRGFTATSAPADVPDAPEGYTMFIAVRPA